MTINSFAIYQSSILYLVLPILLFYLGWLKPGIGFFLSLLLLLAVRSFFKTIKTISGLRNSVILRREHCIAFLVLFIFLLCTGNTGFVGCWGYDIPWRNAIYQDLIRQPWPVVYEYSSSILCYYMVFWLVPAGITSLFHLNEFGSNVVLFIWMYVGLVLIFFLMCDILQPKKEQILLITIIFAFFSGINTLGMILRSFFIEPSPLITSAPGWGSWEFTNFNINGKDIVYLMRSTYLNIADIYNQYFALALSTLIFLKFQKYLDCHVFVVLLTLPYSPIGFIGLFIVVFLNFLSSAIENNKVHGWLVSTRRLFSVASIFAILAVFPVFCFYYVMNANAAIVLEHSPSASTSILYIPKEQFSGANLIILIVYYYLYFIIYARLIYDTFKDNNLFWEIVLCLIVFPIFKIGSSADFTFNATICPYLILCVFIIKHVLQSLNNQTFKIKDFALIFFLSVAMLTPIIQIVSSLRGAYLHDSLSYTDFSLYNAWDTQLLHDSFCDKDINGFRNFLAQGYEDKIFYVFFAKK